MNTKEQMQIARDQAKWAACYALRKLTNHNAQQGSFNWPALAEAMFHAGEAWAYYESSNVVDTLEGKLKSKSEKTKTV